jgi:hypothetical protein
MRRRLFLRFYEHERHNQRTSMQGGTNTDESCAPPEFYPPETHADNAHKQKQKHTYTHTRSQTRSGNHSAEHTHTSTTPERDLAHTVTTCATLSKTSPHGLMHTRHKKQCKHYTLVAGSSSANEKKYTGTARAGAFSSSSPMSSSICGVATGALVAGAFLPSRRFRS